MDTWLKTGRLLSVEKAGLTSTCKSHTSSIPSENSTSHCEAAPLQKATIENEASLSKEYTQINCSKVKKRRYDEEYLSFGFIPIGIDTFPDVRCVVCEKVLSNSSLASAKLKRYLESNHPNLKWKCPDFFRMKKDISIESATSLTIYVKDENEKNTEASFKLSYNIARAGKPHTIAESLIKPSMIEVVSCILGDDAGRKVAAVQCSNNTISDRIHNISDHIEDEFVFRLINCNQFSLQMDESTDVSGLSNVSGLSILIVFARYAHEKTIQEGLLICESLETHTTGENIFDVAVQEAL
ncbi:zinc finger BED domain-containing protein 5-like [Aphis gossypii]|uniref:zinc finger BED domain-containing protein 5-like n=1 Tax=Aphis gossypii TaxID=80765 RepID=UPI0021596C31|nr:zinc finger BED domain-containing protein 5-like [Aphis gossypii]